MKEKIIDILFFLMVLSMIGLDIYGYFRPEDLIDPRIHLLVNALVLAMMGYMIYSRLWCTSSMQRDLSGSANYQ